MRSKFGIYTKKAVIMKIYPNQHTHCHFSNDTNEPMENFFRKAEELGLESFTFTNHFDFNYAVKGNDLIYDLDEEVEEIKKLSKNSKIEVLRGIEMGYDVFGTERMAEVIKNNKFDVVNYSLHTCAGLDFYEIDTIKSYGIKNFLKTYFEYQVEMVEKFTDFDVFCHIDFGFASAFRVDNTLKINEYEPYLIKIMSKVIELDKTFELNTKVQEKIKDDNHVRYLLRLYKKLGGKHITISSDAHHEDRLYAGIPHFIELVKEEGFDHLCYFKDRKRFIFPL